MNFIYSGGTTRQRNLFDQAIAACSYPLDEIRVDVTVVWAAPADDDAATTVADPIDFSYLITIANDLDDPAGSRNAGLLDPVHQTPYFYMETVVHELGHVVSGSTFVGVVGKMKAMCSLFTTTEGGHVRTGVLADFDGPGLWATKIKEAVAECFKCGFYTDKPLIYTNRTKWNLAEGFWGAFLSLLEPTGVISGIVASFGDGLTGASVPVTFDHPVPIEGRPVDAFAVAGGRLVAIVCGSPTSPAGVFQSTNAGVDVVQQLPSGEWLDTFLLIDEIVQEEDGITVCPFRVEYDPADGQPFPPFNLPDSVSGVMSATDSGGPLMTRGLFWSYTMTYTATVPSTGDYLSVTWDMGYDDLDAFTARRGVSVDAFVAGVHYFTDFADFTGFSLTTHDAMDVEVDMITTNVTLDVPYPFGTQSVALAALGPAGIVAGAKALALEGASLTQQGNSESSRALGSPGPPGSSGVTDSKGGVVG